MKPRSGVAKYFWFGKVRAKPAASTPNQHARVVVYRSNEVDHCTAVARVDWATERRVRQRAMELPA